MATIRSAFIDHSLLDDTGDDINGSEVDANPYLLADILDGTTATQLNQTGSMVVLNPEVTDVSAAAGGIRTALRVRHDPASGTVTAGDGPRILFEADDSGGNKTTLGSINFPWVTPTDGATEAANFELTARVAGATPELVSIGTDGFIFNETGVDLDYRFESDTNANAVYFDSGMFSGVGAAAFGGVALNTAFVLVDPPAFTTITTIDVARFKVGNTAAMTSPAGPTAIMASVWIDEPNLAGTAPTSAVSLYVAAAPTEGGTNNYALWVDSGTTKLDGALTVDGTVTLNGATVALASGAALSWNSGDVTQTHAANTLTWAGATSGYVFSDGPMFIGDTSNANNTLGLTIKQGAADNQAFTIKSDDVAHGFLSQVVTCETDDYFVVLKENATLGGTQINSLARNTIVENLHINISGSTANTDKTTAAIGMMGLHFYNHNNNDTFAAIAADGNLFTITARADGSNNTTRYIFDVEGTAHADVAWTTYDLHDDLALISDIENALLSAETIEQTERRHFLETTGIIGKNSWHIENGKQRAMVNFTKLAMLHHGALIQAGERIIALENQLKLLAERN